METTEDRESGVYYSISLSKVIDKSDVVALSERWIQDSKQILKEMEKLSKGKDRLDMVRSMRFSLYALQRSVVGWFTWVNNPDVMARFSLEELKEINETLTKFAESYIEYDIKATEKRTGMPKKRGKRRKEEFYA